MGLNPLELTFLFDIIGVIMETPPEQKIERKNFRDSGPEFS
jgi:hypothetical protein